MSHDNKNQIEKIHLSASELASFIGLNPYQHPKNIMVKMWKKYYPSQYYTQIHNLDRVGKEYEPCERPNETLNRLTQKHKIPIPIELKKCFESKNAQQLQKNQKELICRITETDIPKKEKDKLKEALTSLTNTKYGTHQENKSMLYYTKKYNKLIKTGEHYHKKKLFQYKNQQWYIGGKIDGITEDNVLLEFKNRVRCLFNRIRDYELVQIQTYLHILELESAELVEVLDYKKNNKETNKTSINKNNEEMEMNVLPLNRDPIYWQQQIQKKLEPAIKFFYHLTDSEKLQQALLMETRNIKDWWSFWITQRNYKKL